MVEKEKKKDESQNEKVADDMQALKDGHRKVLDREQQLLQHLITVLSDFERRIKALENV